MLLTRSIPIYDDDNPDYWHTFIYKASIGSIKAADTLNHASMAYMVAFTGDLDSPNTMHLDDYNALVREQFPANCPVESIQQFHDIALNKGFTSVIKPLFFASIKIPKILVERRFSLLETKRPRRSSIKT